MIIIDLEWNCGSDYSGFDEILQIGAVQIKTLGGSILDTFNVHIRPQVNTTLHPAAAKLPELQRSFTDGVCFPIAFLKFREWARHEKDYAAWGEDDFRVLQQMCCSGICRLCPFVRSLISSAVLGSISAQLRK